MKPVAILQPYIDSTMRSCFVSCPEKFRLEFIYGLRPPGISIDLHAGGCFATAVETIHKAFWGEGKSMPEAMMLGHAAFAVAWGDYVIPEYKKTTKTFDRTWAAVEEYMDRFAPLTCHVKPYFVEGKPTFEYSFAIPLEEATHSSDRDPEMRQRYFPLHPVTGEPWLYTGRFDMLGQYLKRPVVLDDKTQGGSISTGWADKWNLRAQFMGYVWACQQSGLDLNTVIVRGVAIQKTQTPIEEAIKVYSDHMIERWHEQLRRDLWRLADAWNEGYFDYNFGDACTSFGNCIFTDVCQSREKEAWMNQFVVTRWNPLSKNPIEEIPNAA